MQQSLAPTTNGLILPPAAERSDSPFLKALRSDRGIISKENPDWFVMLDSYPSRPGHLLVIPKRKFESYFEISPDEWISLNQIIVAIPSLLKSVDLRSQYFKLLEDPLDNSSRSFLNKALGSKYIAEQSNDFTIAVNEGVHAGRSVGHLHIHFVPRFAGDESDPTGGFRWMFSGDGNYSRDLSALGQANRFYNTSNLALQYFRSIREQRGVMPYLKRFMHDCNPSPKNKVAELGFGPGIELEWMLSKGYRLDGIDISGPMNIQLAKILDKKDLLDGKKEFPWRSQARLFPYSLQEFEPGKDSFVRVWSQATLLHLERSEIADTLNKYGASLKRNKRTQPVSKMYVNFKVGESEQLEFDSQGRPFTYFTKDSFMAEIKPLLEELKITRIWVPDNKDAIGRDIKWLNIVLEPK